MANELEQLIKDPSRVTRSTKSLIDVLITSTPNLFKASGALSTTFSDHYPIYGIMKCPAARPTKHRIIKTRSWKESSVRDFLSELEKTPWSFLDCLDDIDDTYSAWESLFKSLIDCHFRTKLKRVRKQTHPWLDRSVLRLMRERDHQHKKAIKHGLSTDWNEFKRLRNMVTSINRKRRKNDFATKLEENRGNPRAYWKKTLRQILPS